MTTRSLVPAFLATLLPASPSTAQEIVHRVTTVEELAALAPALAPDASVPPSESRPATLTIEIAPGTYVLTDSIRIQRSHVTVRGASPGARLVLADGINEPVIAIGSQAEVPAPEEVIASILIAGLEIEGNKNTQTSETSLVRPWIRNNGIDVRATRNLRVDHVKIGGARSGGLVISYDCADVLVTDSIFERSYFDGVAFYASERVKVVRCSMLLNRAAGISLDNDFRDSVFESCIVAGNGDVGVFARNSHRLRFTDCIIQSSRNWAVFLAHDEADRGVTHVTIEGCKVLENQGGVYVASLHERQSSEIEVTRTVFARNLVNGRANVQTCGTRLTLADLTEESDESILPVAAATPL